MCMSISLHIYLRGDDQQETKLAALEYIVCSIVVLRPRETTCWYQSRQEGTLARNGIDQRAGILLTARVKVLKNKTQKHLNSTKIVIARGRGGGCFNC